MDILFEEALKSWTKNFWGAVHGRCPLFMGKAVERKDENYNLLGFISFCALY